MWENIKTYEQPKNQKNHSFTTDKHQQSILPCNATFLPSIGEQGKKLWDFELITRALQYSYNGRDQVPFVRNE